MSEENTIEGPEELKKELWDYLQKLLKMNRAELLEEMYQVKRSKQPEMYTLIECVFRAMIKNATHEEKVKIWIASLIGHTIVLNPQNGPVKILDAKPNSRYNAAIITVENDIRTHYISYKGE